MYWVAFHDTDIFDLIQHNEILLSLDIIKLNRNSFLYLQISISDAIVTLLLHRRYMPQRCVTIFQCIFLLFENEICESFINRHRSKLFPDCIKRKSQQINHVTYTAIAEINTILKNTGKRFCARVDSG